MEDGAEQRNTLHHNLAALTLAGTLLPHDRNFQMCQSLTDGTYEDYVPFPPFECMYVHLVLSRLKFVDIFLHDFYILNILYQNCNTIH